MKKILSILLAMLLMFSVMPTELFTITASAATSGTTGSCTWTLDGTTLTISGNGKMNGYNVYSSAPWGTSITSVVIEDGVTSIGDYAFYDCTSLTSITIGGSVTSIGDYAFRNCSGLTSITIPNSVTSIGRYAFSWCDRLTSVTIGDSVTSIGDSAFYGCSSLTSINVESGNNYYSSQDGVLFNKTKTEIIRYPAGKTSTTYTIPSSVTSIGGSAFSFCSKLTSITIPNSVTSIGYSAFYDCKSLTSITIPNSVTSIDSLTFYNCSKLTSITIPNSVTSIGYYAFYNCTSLTSITIPNSVTVIPEYAFENCDSLTSITIPNSVTSIGHHAFVSCSKLTSITIGSGVTSIGSNAFDYCSVLTKVNIIDLKAWCEIEFYNSSSNPLCYAEKLCLNDEIVTDLVIPKGITKIENYAFCNCTSLTSVTIPDSVTSIGDCAFSNCSKLISITIPNSVTSIGGYAFSNCTSLEKVNITDLKAWCEIKFSRYDANPLYYAKNLYLNDVLVTNLVIPEGTTKIGNSAFCNCTSLTSITIPDSVTSIHYSAFSGCPVTIRCNDGSYAVTFAKDNNLSFEIINLQIPEVPTVSSVTANTVTLNAVSGYEYSKDGINWQSSNVFTGLQAATKYTFYQRIAAKDIYGASVVSKSVSVKTDKSSNSYIPAAPTVADTTYNSVTLTVIPGYEYSKDGITWQTSNIFTGLTVSTKYNFYVRVAETDTVYASAASPALSVTTKKYDCTTKPAAPKVAKITAATVELQLATGCEYSKDGVNWQSSNVFTNLLQTTEYTFYQRLAETNTAYASPASSGLIVKTKEKTACLNKADKPIVMHTEAKTITLVERNGYEYKMDDGNWQDSPVFSDLKIGSEHVFYQRIKETPEFLASNTSEGVKAETFNSALSTNFGYDLFQLYIQAYGSVNSSGNMQIYYTNYVDGTLEKYYMEDVGSAIKLSRLNSSTSGDTKIDYKTIVTIRKNDRNVSANFNYTVYYGKTEVANPEYSTTFDRSTITTDTVLSISDGVEYGTSVYNLFHGSVHLILSHTALKLIENISMNLDAIGFLMYPSGEISTRYCDPATNLHLGTTEIYHKYDAGCDYDGYTGDTYCNHCYELMRSGSVIKSDGKHSYSNSCDEKCNDCSYKREIVHTYSNDCDNECNVCNAKREATHIYDDDCDSHCNRCNVKRKPPHIYDNQDDMICNNCGYERPSVTNISITTKPNKLTYIEGDSFNPAGMVVSANYSDNTSEYITDYTISGYTSTIGTKTITVSYGGKTATFTVTVEHKHIYSSATCTKPATCEICGATTGKALGHKYQNDCDETCNICGEIRNVPDHKYDNECDTACNICGATRTVLHRLSDATCTKPATCKICGTTTGKALGHTYSNDCDTTCNECGEKRSITHKYDSGVITKAATCKATGVKTYTCTVCEATKTETIKKTTTHKYTTTTTKATLTKNGSIVKKCSICGYVASTTAINYVKSFALTTTSYTYSGAVRTPGVIVKDSAGKTLVKNTDYTVSYASGRKNAGTYKVTVTMKGKYSGTKTLTFKINPISYSKCKFALTTTNYTYNGGVKTPGVTIKYGSLTLKKNVDYTVAYASGRKNVGTYKVTIKMKGNYTGTKTLTFKINPKAASVNKLTAGSKKLTVKLNRSLQQSTGYQIQYSTSKTFKNAKTKTITSYKTSSTTLTGLKAKTTYYVRVRTYKTVGKTKYYSGWSTYKYVKTK